MIEILPSTQYQRSTQRSPMLQALYRFIQKHHLDDVPYFDVLRHAQLHGVPELVHVRFRWENDPTPDILKVLGDFVANHYMYISSTLGGTLQEDGTHYLLFTLEGQI